MRNASFGTSLGFLFFITLGAGSADAQLAAEARAGVSVAPVSVAPVSVAPPGSARGDSARLSIGGRVAMFGATYLLVWPIGAIAGGVVGTGRFGECFGDDCPPPVGKARALTSMGAGGGTTIVLAFAGGGGQVYRRCGFGSRLARATAGAVVGSIPGTVHAAAGGEVAAVYVMGAGQLIGTMMALESCLPAKTGAR